MSTYKDTMQHSSVTTPAKTPQNKDKADIVDSNGARLATQGTGTTH